MDYQSIVAWLAPIISTIIVTAATASINAQVKRHEVVADERHAETEAKRAAEAEWRDSVDGRLEELAKGISDVEDKTNRSIAVQAAQIRSDIIHKCHRYLDDLGKASTEEKEALSDEHRQYTQFCEDLDVENNFIDALVSRVMELPERDA